MTAGLMDRHETSGLTAAMDVARRAAWLVIFFVDAGFVVWGAMAAFAPEYLLGPASKPILVAGYEGYTGASWAQFVQASPRSAGYIELLFRTYGAYSIALALPAMALAATAFRRGDAWAWWALLLGNTIALVAAMRYDWIANAIGPFEMTEYAGLALILAAHAVTAPFFAAGRPARSGGA